MTLTEQIKRVQSFDIVLSNVNIESTTDEGDQIVINGPGEIEINVTKDSEGNYIVPNFSESLSGELIIDITDTVVLREIPLEEAMDLMLIYIQENPGARTSDIICDLGIDVEIGLNALKKLSENEVIDAEE